MRMNTQRILAALLSLVLLLALTPSGWAVDLTIENTVKVNLVSQTDYATDIVKADITVDFYLIANAEPVTGYDTYSLKVNSPYKDLSVSEAAEDGTHLTLQQGLDKQVNSESPNYDEIIELLAEATLKEETSPQPTPSPFTISEDKSTITASGLAAGMYLMVPHGTVIPGTEISTKTGNTGYVKTIATGEGTAAQTLYRTRAYSDNYEYMFKPQLVTVPGKEIKTGEGDSATSVPTYRTDEGTWTYAVPVNVKVERVPRNGILKITKTLTNYTDLSKDGSYFEPMTFTFSVVGRDKGGNIVYQKVVALSVDSPVSEALVATLEDIPVGTSVTVTEIYNGAHATGRTDSQTVEIQAPTAAADGTTTTITSNVSFTNVNNDTHRGGHGIENKFTFNKSTGRWDWVATGRDGATSESEVEG